MVVNSHNVFTDEQTSITFTPTTLKNITQIFESDNSMRNLQQFKQSGFVSPLQPAVNKSNWPSYSGVYTTFVTPIKFEIPTTLKVEKESSSEEELDQYNSEEDDYEPKAKKIMQTRNAGVRRTSVINFNNSNNNSRDRKEPVKRKSKGNKKDDYDDLPYVERQQLLLRRERNKLAAARCRQRREDLIKSLTIEVKIWKGQNEDLEKEVQKLRSEKEELEYILQAHSSTCGLSLVQKRNPVQVVAVKSEPEVFMTEDVKPLRPTNLSIPFSNRSYLEQSGPEGVIIETPSTVIPCFDNFMTSSGLTPVVSSITTSGFYSNGFLNSPVTTCSYQQRSKDVPDLNTPGETVSLVSL